MNKLLKTRICDLELDLNKGQMSTLISRLLSELKVKKINMTPHFWISDEWFCPDDHTGLAIPFYLLSEELQDLERKMIGYCEGDNSHWAMKLLRHELGHVIDNAFNLKENKERKLIFGDSLIAYPENYSPKKYSKNFVQHLEDNYAQAHPDEDWAETFALWLTPKSNWRNIYSHGALKKLLTLDKLMKEIKNTPATTLNNSEVDSYKDDTRTLQEYYSQKRKRLKLNSSRYFTQSLSSVLTKNENKRVSAKSFIAQNRKEIRQKVAKNTNQYQYRIDRMLSDLEKECSNSSLYINDRESCVKNTIVHTLSIKSASYFNQGRDRIIM